MNLLLCAVVKHMYPKDGLNVPDKDGIRAGREADDEPDSGSPSRLAANSSVVSWNPCQSSSSADLLSSGYLPSSSPRSLEARFEPEERP